jgi:hydrogenase nickel incorporation protein HypA/HybF
MHELPVTESLLEITLRHADAARASHVEAVHVVIGELSSIVDDSVRFYWDIISQDTKASGSRLEFRRVPARLKCPDCGTEYGARDDSLICPTCACARAEILAGDEFHLEALDVVGTEDAPQAA